MKCDVCGSLETIVKEHNHDYVIKGKKIEFKSLRRFCKECGNLVYDSELDNVASKKAIEIYNDKYGITKEEIINFRKSYNLSQSLFSKIIGCAKKTLISYEKGDSIPNDNYIIILKSLIANPKIIFTIINANKDQFTEKEYLKLVSNNNLNQFFFKEEFSASEYNGYASLNKDKIYNIILFLAQKGILKTKLLKEMFYVDFLYYKETCQSITGLEYAKINLGPVPDQYEKIINDCVEKDLISYTFEIKNEYEYHKITSKKKFNESIFNDEEIKILNKVNDYFKNFTSKEIMEYSHNEKAFVNTEFYKKISYDYSFDIDL